jgi:OmpA-OmpF porin, OOP family
MRLKAASLLVALAALAAPRARAQGVPGFDLERLQLDPTAQGSLVVGSGEVGLAGSSRTSIAFGFQHNPVVLLSDGTFRGRGVGANGTVTGSLVDNRISAAVTGAVAVVDRLEIYFRAPLVAWQHGQNLGASGIGKPQNYGLGNPSVGLRIGLVAQADGAPLSLALAGEIFPSWGTEAAVGGNGGFAWLPRVELGRRFERAQVSANAYALFREANIPLRGGENLGNEYGGGLAVSSLGRVRGEVSLRFAVNEFKLSQSYEALGGVRWAAGPVELYALAGPGFGAAPGTPTFRAVAGLAYGRSM